MEPLYQIDLESGNPQPKSAIKYLEFVIASVRARNGKVIKAWHGNDRNRTAASKNRCARFSVA